MIWCLDTSMTLSSVNVRIFTAMLSNDKLVNKTSITRPRRQLYKSSNSPLRGLGVFKIEIPGPRVLDSFGAMA